MIAQTFLMIMNKDLHSRVMRKMRRMNTAGQYLLQFFIV